MLFVIAQLPSVLFMFQQNIQSVLEISGILRLFALWLGISGLTCLAFSALLTFRHPLAERLTFGLDNLYRLHHFAGIWAVVFILGHVFFLVLSNYIVSKEAALYLLRPWNHPRELILGWLSLFLLSVVSIAASKLDRGHRLWRYLHFLSVPAYIFAFYHFYSYTTALGGLRIALSTLLALGFIVSLMRAFKYIFAYRYLVEGVKHLDHRHTVISLTPVGKRLRHRPGQYVFAAFHTAQGYQACNEFHPFTITSLPKNRELELIVKAKGDCTCRLQKVVSGIHAHLEGPFGGLEPGAGSQIWIGGGIGVGPLIPLLETKTNDNCPIDLYYVARNEDEHVLLPRLYDAATNRKHIAIYPVSIEGDATELMSIIEEKTPDFAKRSFLLSGPPQMILDLQRLLTSLGISPKKIKHESCGLFVASCIFLLAWACFCPGSIALAQETEVVFDSIEVAIHNSDKSCWLVIDNKVYDVTPYIPKHPASPKTILDYCGKEATVAFHTKDNGRPHSQKAVKSLSRYLIGRLKALESGSSLYPRHARFSTVGNE